MAQRTKSVADPPDTAIGGTRDGRRARRLERRVAKARDLEVKRARQLEKARERRADLEGRLATLRQASAPTAAAPKGPTVGPTAYCLRERRSVAMVDPAPIVMRNGRSGLAGTCPSCGARVVTTSKAAVAALEG